MKFIVDAHLPSALCRVINLAGHDAIHVTQQPNGNRTSDTEINRISVTDERVVVTKDSDFYYSRLVTRRPWKLLLIRTGNLRGRDLIDSVERHLSEIVLLLEQNDIIELHRERVSMPSTQ